MESNSDLVHVIATIELKPGRRDDFLQEFHSIVPQVLKEDGCLEYGPTIDVVTAIEAQGDARDDIVVIIEKWRSLDALENHLIAPHMLEYRKRVKEMIVGAQLQVLAPA